MKKIWSYDHFFLFQVTLTTTTNITDQGAALSASPASRSYSEKYFAGNFVIIKRVIQRRNGCAAWARKLGITKKDIPEILRIHEELRRSGENLDRILAEMGDIPLFKLPASEKELDKMVQKFSTPTPSPEIKTVPIAAPSPSQDRPESAPRGKKQRKGPGIAKNSSLLPNT
ncbi:hypothetical protein NPIL_115681 [Nephila pilipes]|uniref:Uncharacterized protein n=1 Tax=Nephila pilipes TaxID=299642 RepID=A0A8X6UNA8_NEPPI|nr:hypothetical protein NPIL_115681 [Nephila pilipes]